MVMTYNNGTQRCCIEKVCGKEGNEEEEEEVEGKRRREKGEGGTVTQSRRCC
jgi:hypothetical protein